MFQITQGTYFHFLIAAGVTTFLGKSDYPDFSGEAIYLDELNSHHELSPHWEAVGIQVFVDETHENHCNILMPAQSLYDFKKEMREKVKNLLDVGHREVHYAELHAKAFPSLIAEFTFSRQEDGTWTAEDLPVERSLVASTPELDIVDELHKMASIIHKACGGSCCKKDQENTWYDEEEGSSWYDEAVEAHKVSEDSDEDDWDYQDNIDDWDGDGVEDYDDENFVYEYFDEDTGEWREDTYEDDEDDWEDYDDDDDWEDEDDWEDFEEGDWEDDEDDDYTEARPQRSKSRDYLNRRKRDRRNRTQRKRRNKQLRKKRKKPSEKNKAKRYRRRRRNKPRSRRRSPKKIG
jgi:hypothetical protein